MDLFLWSKRNLEKVELMSLVITRQMEMGSKGQESETGTKG